MFLLVKYRDITVERDVSPPGQTGLFVGLVQLVFVALSLGQERRRVRDYNFYSQFTVKSLIRLVRLVLYENMEAGRVVPLTQS